MATRRGKTPKSSAKRKKGGAQGSARGVVAAFDAVRRIAHGLEGVEDGVSYGTAALKVHGALFIRLREDDDTLVLRCPIEDRDALIADDPDTYFFTEHYAKYPWVLARLSTINPTALKDVVRMAHQNALKEKPRRKKPRA